MQIKNKQLWMAVFLLTATFFAVPLKAQVTVGALTEPHSTLEVVTQPAGSTTPDGIMAPRMALSQLNARSALYTTDQKGALVYVTLVDVATIPQTVNITAAGYYYFDGAVWVKITDSKNPAWLLGGNTNGSLQTLGTKDANDLPVITNNTEKMRVTAGGNVGIGTATPATKLEINSGTGDVSGLKFTNLNGYTPESAGATLGVDASGNVVTVPGNAFLPQFMQNFSGASVVLYNATPNYSLASITITVKGTYLIIYQVSAQTVGNVMMTGDPPNADGTASNFCSAFISTGASAATIVPNSQVLVYKGRGDAASNIYGGTGAGTQIITLTAADVPITFYLGAVTEGSRGTAYNDGYSHTSIAAVKITP